MDSILSIYQLENQLLHLYIFLLFCISILQKGFVSYFTLSFDFVCMNSVMFVNLMFGPNGYTIDLQPLLGYLQNVYPHFSTLFWKKTEFAYRQITYLYHHYFFYKYCFHIGITLQNIPDLHCKN